MDIYLFAVKLNRPLRAAETETMLRVMPPERRERLARMPRDELRQEPLCAYAVLYMATRSLCGWKKLPEMRYNRYGKPEFADYPELQFNISHTRQAALVGLHEEPIGVDIEKLRPVSERTMQRIAGTASQQEFFERWVRREARGKWTGAGISSIREEEKGALRGERIVYLDTFPGYAACLCTHSDARIRHVKTFEIN
ncbi:MAG: 4'-phosphopantetheinyl transferase [Oscillospiraceae bacterium]|nr:4'-phosphopantetheinyl transferase [Oscillospiraceae bacterium]